MTDEKLKRLIYVKGYETAKALYQPKEAKWRKDKNDKYITCTNCGYPFSSKIRRIISCNYCAYCGAKMIGVEDNELFGWSVNSN